MTNAEATLEVQATQSEIDKLVTAVTTAEATLATAKAEGDAKLPALIKASNYGTEFAELSGAISKATVNLERAQDALRAGRASSVWEQLVETREAIILAAHTFILDAVIPAPLTGIRGVITIVDGDAVVTLTPVMGKLDMADIEQLIGSEVDVARLQAEGVTSLDLDIAHIGETKDDGASATTVTIAPSTSKTLATRNSTRTGKVEYEFNGTWYGSHDLLVALEAAGHQITTDRAQSFETALRGTGNGMSNLAKSVAKSLNLTTRDAEAATPSA